MTRVHSKTQGPENSCTDGDNTANHVPIKISNSKRNHKISQTNVEGSTPIEVGARMIAAEEDSTPIRTSTKKRVLPMKFESDKSCGSNPKRKSQRNLEKLKDTVQSSPTIADGDLTDLKSDKTKKKNKANKAKSKDPSSSSETPLFDSERFEITERITTKIPNLDSTSSQSHKCICNKPVRACPTSSNGTSVHPNDDADNELPEAEVDSTPRRDAATDFSHPMECFRLFNLYYLSYAFAIHSNSAKRGLYLTKKL